jgi:flagellar motility protein MotE (MotC chaperone)
VIASIFLRPAGRRFAAWAIILSAALPAAAAEKPAGEGAPPVVSASVAGTVDANAALYCRNIANPAADARYARQADSLAKMEKQVEARIAELEKKRAEYEEWVNRRSDFLAKADESVVAIYSQMRPDAAAQQISIMDAEAAAAILSKLQPRTASAILNEMDARVAAHLTNVMAGMPATDGKAGS